ncbi:Dirigent protein [Dillenia turbinata]|uniref:Dirigent protein n=1 Tax=Dillenia turbinata TaxID=194707 RepID=A0AAN8UWC9_9MAGN
MATINTALLLLCMGICLVDAKQTKTNMVFYMHDWQSGNDSTAMPIAGVKSKPWNTVQFGTLFVIDDALTVGLDRASAQVGWAHGVYVNSALDGSDLHLVLSLVFTSKEHNGSTLEIQGADRLFQKYREVSVVSGTGRFRFARGYATLETAFLDLKSADASIRWNLTVLHY